MKKPILFLLSIFLFLSACQATENLSNPPNAPNKQHQTTQFKSDHIPDLRAIAEKYKGKQPKEWGEKVTGVITRLPTNKPVIALTLDACGGKRGSGYDRELIDYLRKEKIPATLFVNARWIKANLPIFLELAKDPLFEIANHGTEHRPLSVNGKSVYGIRGTKNVEEVISEVWTNHQLITQLTHKEPKFFRSGTAYYDEISVQIVKELGEKAVSFDVLGDGGARFSKEQVKQALLSAKPGSIIILHMNQPASETAEGVKEAIPILKQKGFRFVKLSESLR
jgi:peptidoglycan/xylan/chitin deacetylase (PgdA/CDA1 family)